MGKTIFCLPSLIKMINFITIMIETDTKNPKLNLPALPKLPELPPLPPLPKFDTDDSFEKRREEFLKKMESAKNSEPAKVEDK